MKRRRPAAYAWRRTRLQSTSYGDANRSKTKGGRRIAYLPALTASYFQLQCGMELLPHLKPRCQEPSGALLVKSYQKKQGKDADVTSVTGNTCRKASRTSASRSRQGNACKEPLRRVKKWLSYRSPQGSRVNRRRSPMVIRMAATSTPLETIGDWGE